MDREIAQEIRDGTVAIQLIRPYHYLMVKLFQGLGEGLFRLLLFSLPGDGDCCSYFSDFFTGIMEPSWFYFSLSLVGGFLINAQLNNHNGIACLFHFK